MPVTRRSPAFSRDGPYFSGCTESLQLHSDTVTISSRAIASLSHPTQGNTSLKSRGGKEPAGFKRSTKSKLCVRDMSEATLTAQSVCSASAKLIVVVVSSPLSPCFPLPGEKLSVLPASKRGLLEKKINTEVFLFLFILTERGRSRRQAPVVMPSWRASVRKSIDPSV